MAFDGLTPKQQLFCQEYIVDLNASGAALRAGYAESGAGTEGYRLLKNAQIESYIDKLKLDREKRTAVTADRVIAELAKLGFSDIRSHYTSAGGIVDIQDLDDDTAAALQAVKVVKKQSGECDEAGNPVYDEVVEFKLADKKAALELLGRHMAMFTDRKELGLTPEAEAFVMKIG